ncbi:hypothetical protein SNE25_24340 [Mucilaginibacter sabulilitoris]|uniref:Uncharacterized protein n=1 Tax=Mucilaginibacter sabulilitoris TaxID=1173583 RepID=A0ABZ0TI19_9SPHI|nr:hypothetical protein [Mucilaginibacter sabulilitoris]WPU92461.1 hypothetical protein SNE25_24340 [Mucilaginibacter sabulilitoris]
MTRPLFPIEHTLRAVIALFYRLHNHPLLLVVFGESPEQQLTLFCKDILERVIVMYQPKEVVYQSLRHNTTLLQAYYPLGFQAIRSVLAETFEK